MEEKEAKFASWIDDLLEAAKENPDTDATRLISMCGQGCARRKGAIEGIRQLREMAKECQSRADYVEFFKNTLHIYAVEAADGIELHLGKPHCTCPMAPEVSNGMLCNCTRGHELLVWGEFFQKPIDIEIMESHLRGGKDCVIKIIV